MTGLDVNNLLAISRNEPSYGFGSGSGYGYGYGYGSGYGSGDGSGSGGSSTPELINTGHAPEKASLT